MTFSLGIWKQIFRVNANRVWVSVSVLVENDPVFADTIRSKMKSGARSRQH